jgi:N-methylhydantoinase A
MIARRRRGSWSWRRERRLTEGCRARVGGALHDLPVWSFLELAPDQRVAGPAIVESDTTTVLLLPGDVARLDARGWLEVGG